MADSQEAIELRRRARRRLVGAIALVVFMVIALPIVLDREPKLVSQELTIQIPSQDAGQFASRVASPEPPPAAPPADADAAAAVVTTPLAATAEPTQARSDKAAKGAVAPSSKPGVSPSTADKGDKPEAAPVPVARSEKPAAAAAPAAKEASTESAKTEVPKAEASKAGSGFIVPLGLFSKPDNVKQVRGKASASGIKTYTEALADSDRVRVRAGPFATRDAAEKAREKLKAAGLDVGAVAAR